MSKIFFIADTHFGSEELFLYENRPFENTNQMDQVMIENWNKAVSPDDTVWHLGDFGADGYEAELLKKLNGRKYLIKGNHDTGSNEYYRNAGFEWVYDYPVIIEDYWILSHKPLYVNANMPYANVFGHVHASPIVRDFSSQHMCVCVERTGYTPVSFEELRLKCSMAGSSSVDRCNE